MILVILLIMFLIVFFWHEPEPKVKKPPRQPQWIENLDPNDPGQEMVITGIWDEYQALETYNWYEVHREELGMTHDEIVDQFPYATNLDACYEAYQERHGHE